MSSCTTARSGQAASHTSSKGSILKSDLGQLVYLRDPSWLQSGGPRKFAEAFTHSNELNLKEMLFLREYRSEEKDLSPQIKAAINFKQRQFKRHYESVYHLLGPSDKTLLFESKFECGNLFLAQKVSDAEYNLLMQNDVNTSGYTQWFYFKVENTCKGATVKFNLLNYTKPDSLFNFGMKVAVYSEKRAQESHCGWSKEGQNIFYFPN